MIEQIISAQERFKNDTKINEMKLAFEKIRLTNLYLD
jgi:hypothetical protein